MRGEPAGRRKDDEEGCDASVRDCGVVWAGGRSMMHGEAETGLVEVSWVCAGDGVWGPSWIITLIGSVGVGMCRRSTRRGGDLARHGGTGRERRA